MRKLLLPAEEQWSRLESLSKTVELGMTAEEVRRILGEPNGGSPDGSNIYYEAPNWRLHGTPEIVVRFEGAHVVGVDAYPFVQIPFDEQDWKGSQPQRRGCMVQDLMKRFAGKVPTREALVEFLGDPSSWRRAGEVAVYGLGSDWPPLVEAPWDGAWDHLVIVLDGDDVVRWEVMGDWPLREFAPK